jgi:hypothetical protein
MKTKRIAVVATLALALTSTANGQFSESGGGSAVPSSGTGGDANAAGDAGALYDTVQAGLPGTSSVNVANAVTSITSVEIQGLAHTWCGDTQATLEDPAGVEHLLWLRPGFLNTSNFGNSGDFDGGNFTIVDDGSGADFPTNSTSVVVAGGT